MIINNLQKCSPDRFEHTKLLWAQRNKRTKCILCWGIFRTLSAWKMSKYGVFSASYFPAFGLDTEIYGVNLHIKSKYSKIRTRKNSVFDHFSCSESVSQNALSQMSDWVLIRLSKVLLPQWSSIKKKKSQFWYNSMPFFSV